MRGQECGGMTPVSEEVLDNLLRQHSGSDPDATIALQESFDRYGPWNAAGVMLRSALGRSATYGWDEEAEDLLTEAKLRLKIRHRIKFANERRMERNRRHFPHTTDLLTRIGLVLLGALAGFLLGRLSGG